MPPAENRPRANPLLHANGWRHAESDIAEAMRLIAAPHSIEPRFTPIIATKVGVPALGANQVARPRLTGALDMALDRALTLIAAPAGYGKTTLLAEWVRQSPRPIAWVSLDASDSDPHQFWAYVVAALEVAQPDLGNLVRGLVPGREAPIEQVLAVLINTLNKAEPLALVLDNYQLIAADAVHQSLAFMLDHLPAPFHVVLASRAEPPLPLARWRLASILNDLTAADLRFSQSEANSLFEQTLLAPITPQAARTLVEHTEGWAAGLRLAAHIAPDFDDIATVVEHFGGHRDVQDYLEEVLGPLPTNIQMFLLQTSVLDRMCAQLCDAILEIEPMALQLGDQLAHEHISRFTGHPAHVFDSYSQMILAELERAGLFLVALDGERTWYRYNSLFAAVLRYRLNQEAPARAAALRQKAAAWYAEHDQADGEHAPASLLPLSATPDRTSLSVEFTLSSRERDVLGLLVDGYSNQDIAATLIIGVNTVKMHVKHIYAKLDAHNRTQAVAQARRVGLV